MRAVNLLLKGGENGITALHDAVENSHLEITRLLMQFGGKIGITIMNFR